MLDVVQCVADDDVQCAWSNSNVVAIDPPNGNGSDLIKELAWLFCKSFESFGVVPIQIPDVRTLQTQIRNHPRQAQQPSIPPPKARHAYDNASIIDHTSQRYSILPNTGDGCMRGGRSLEIRSSGLGCLGLPLIEDHAPPREVLFTMHIYCDFASSECRTAISMDIR
jgi:hypothetical protein